MRRTWLVLAVLAGCRFDPSGIGANGNPSGDAAVIDGAVVPDALPGTPDAATPDGRPGTPDARPTPDARSTPDAMTTPPDAGPIVGVACGATTCSPGDVCCVSFPGGQTQLACNTQCGMGDLTYACDGPEDCPGQDCCLHNSAFNYGSACEDGCGNGTQTTCNTAADCPSQGDKCCASGVGAIRVCQGSNSQCN